MAKLTLEVIEKVARDAFVAWASARQPKGTWEVLCRVSPNEGFNQGSVAHTAFAAAFFGEVASVVREGSDSIVRVTYRGIPRKEQQPLDTLVTARLAGVVLEHCEHCALDFSLLAHRATSAEPYTIRLAVESEMKPMSGKGDDPDQLAPDLVKLAAIDAQYKLFFGRVNGGNEGAGKKKRPKWDRMRPVIESALQFSGNRALETVAVLLETRPKGEWTCHVIQQELGAAPTHGSFKVQAV